MGNRLTPPPRNLPAEQALVATCVYISLAGLGSRDLDLWSAEIRKLVKLCAGAPETMTLFVVAAANVGDAHPADRAGPLARLRIVVRDYYELQAAARMELVV